MSVNANTTETGPFVDMVQRRLSSRKSGSVASRCSLQSKNVLWLLFHEDESANLNSPSEITLSILELHCGYHESLFVLFSSFLIR